MSSSTIYRLLWTLLFFTILMILVLTPGIIQLRYPEFVDNDPLTQPQKVVSHSGETIELDDGRMFRIAAPEEDVHDALEESEFYVDIIQQPDQGGYEIYARRLRYVCGTPWVALINIPLIPEKVNVNQRELLGTASPVSNSTE